MDLHSGIVTSAVAIDILAGLICAVAYARKPSERDQGVAAALSAAAAVHAVGVLLSSLGRPNVAAMGAVAARIGLAAVAPLALHFALSYRGGPLRRRQVASFYLLGAACAGLDLLGGAPRASYGAAVVAAASVLLLVARTYLVGRREALAVVMGATVLLATVLHDFGVALGGLSAEYLVDAGMAAFAASILSTSSARYAAVAIELERRTQDLRTRTRELGRSYEELRAAQEELLKKEQLAVVGELAAVIAHEVRNPLAIIANAVAGLRKQAISRDDHETLLAILDEETSRLNRLVTDLLRYARPVNVQRTDFSLADVLERALSLVTKDRKAIRTELKVERHDGRIWGDANLLRQVFDNLVVNAMQAMGPGGVLTVRVRTATEEGVDGVAVDIIDTGEGMDTQVRSRARDPFFTTRPSGTGLGLAIVDRIVDAHGGHLAIDSRAGEGTTVTVFLPIGSANEPAPARARAAKTPAELGSARQA